MSAFSDLVKRGTRAAQPAATAVAVGTLYCVSNESSIVERSTGAAWESYSPAASAGAGWTLVSSVTASTGSVPFIGLAAYAEIMVTGYAITVTGTCVIQMQVSIDNGANYLGASGDYKTISNTAFTAADDTAMSCSDNSNTTRYFARTISLWNKTNHKPSWVFNAVGNNNAYYIPTANALNALKVITSSNAFNGGTIAVYGR